MKSAKNEHLHILVTLRPGQHEVSYSIQIMVGFPHIKFSREFVFDSSRVKQKLKLTFHLRRVFVAIRLIFIRLHSDFCYSQVRSGFKRRKFVVSNISWTNLSLPERQQVKTSLYKLIFDTFLLSWLNPFTYKIVARCSTEKKCSINVSQSLLTLFLPDYSRKSVPFCDFVPRLRLSPSTSFSK